MSPSSCQVLSSWATTEQSRQQLLHMQRLAMVGMMSSQVAHELNNTLMVVLGRARQALKCSGDSEMSAKSLRRVLDNSERAAEICQGILGLARSKSGAKETLLVNDIIKEATSSLDGQLARQSITLRVSCPDDLAVCGRRVELVQVLMNLVINSCQAMGDDGGMLRISGQRDESTGCVSISVADSGPGIGAEDIRRVFEPFFSTKQFDDHSGQSGTGLGLAICRDIITDHGGFIEVQSDQAQGATFTLFLPSGSS